MSRIAAVSSSKDVSSTTSTLGLEPTGLARAASWRGVSLGGWLLLEPGTAHALFDKYRGENGRKLLCEWDLMKVMRKRGALAELTAHRETCISKRDFEKIRDMGLNAVRVPFGYWIVIGKTCRDPYHGEGWEYLDRAVQWAEECGLKVLLDLHGAPGGESGEAPCGRQQAKGAWKWDNWRFNASLKALRLVAQRYQSSPAVTGIAVCNEPSPKVPMDALCSFYKRAVEVVRKAGMPAEDVTVVLPVFQRSFEPFVQNWDTLVGESSREGICFEVHWYHCFENDWHGRTFAEHLRAVQEHAHELRRFPIVVGEWSLALGCGAYHGRHSREEMRALFAHAQLAAYQEASHGWFFWNWCDHHSIDWDWQNAHKEGYLPLNSELLFQLPDLPPDEDTESDPLEILFDTPPTDPRIRLGDTVYLRAFNGRYLDVEGPDVRARYSDRGKWQQFVLCPFGHVAGKEESPSLCDGDIVTLLAHNDCYLGVQDTQVSASWAAAEDACAFMVRTQGSEELRHRSPVFLQSLTTSRVLAPNESDPAAKDRLLARWEDFGKWQRFIMEKPLSTAVTPHRPRRRSIFPGQVSSCGTPRTGRRSSTGCGTPGSGLRTSADLERTLRRRSSISSAEQPAPRRIPQRSNSSASDSAPATPVRRRTSNASHISGAFTVPHEPSILPGTDLDMRDAVTTPSKRRNSLDEELGEVPTPSRRRRLSIKSAPSDLFGTPLKKDLAAVFEED